MKNYDLYIITNKINYKKYIGITKVGFEKRLQTHIDNATRFYERSQNIILYIAMRKHGYENFDIEFLAEGNDWDHLCELEIEAIKEHNTYIGIENSWGYNQTIGGDGNEGYKWTEEQLANHSRPEQTEEIRNKKRNHPNSKPWLGKSLSDEHRNSISETMTGRKLPEIVKENMRKNAKRGKNNHKSKPLLVDGIRYETVTAASKNVGFSQNCVARRANNPEVINYQWIKK